MKNTGPSATLVKTDYIPRSCPRPGQVRINKCLILCKLIVQKISKYSQNSILSGPNFTAKLFLQWAKIQITARGVVQVHRFYEH